MFISSFKFPWHQLQGTIRKKQYLILFQMEGFLQYKYGFGMSKTEQELDLAHKFVYIYLYLYIKLTAASKCISKRMQSMNQTKISTGNAHGYTCTRIRISVRRSYCGGEWEVKKGQEHSTFNKKCGINTRAFLSPSTE